MNVTRCDNHPDRAAVVTLSIRLLMTGGRFTTEPRASDPTHHFADLCEVCMNTAGEVLRDVQKQRLEKERLAHEREEQMRAVEQDVTKIEADIAAMREP